MASKSTDWAQRHLRRDYEETMKMPARQVGGYAIYNGKVLKTLNNMG